MKQVHNGNDIKYRVLNYGTPNVYAICPRRYD